MGSGKSVIFMLALGCNQCDGRPAAVTRADRNHEAPMSRTEDLKSSAGGDVAALIAAARAQEAGADEGHLRDVYSEVWRAGLASAALPDRQSAVDYLLERARRREGYLHDLVLRLLLSFRRADFSDAARAQLEVMVKQGVSAPLARVVGLAEATKTIPRLQAAMAAGFAERTPALKVDPAWGAALALARMGDAESQKQIAARVQKESDVILRDTQLFPDLGYTKAPASFDLLRHYLDSDQRLPTLKPTQAQGEREAAHAAKVILAHVEGAPKVEGLDDDSLVRTVKTWVGQLSSWPIWR
jgi:hypothetical protein